MTLQISSTGCQAQGFEENLKLRVGGEVGKQGVPSLGRRKQEYEIASLIFFHFLFEKIITVFRKILLVMFCVVQKYNDRTFGGLYSI